MPEQNTRIPDQCNIIHECSSFVIVCKPHGLPTVPLKNQDPGITPTLLGCVARQFPAVLEVTGRNPWEHGALHRLDTATAGLVVFALEQGFYDHLQKAQAEGLFAKTYMAMTDGPSALTSHLKFIDLPAEPVNFPITTYFRPYGPKAREVRATLDIRKAEPRVLYTTWVTKVDGGFECTITKGFRHQIRVHLASTGNPIAGDSLYGNGTPDSILSLECTAVRFPLQDGRTFTKHITSDNI